MDMLFFICKIQWKPLLPLNATFYDEMKDEHIYLLIEYKDDYPRKESVHARKIGPNRYKLLYTPGFILGIAADDEFRILNEDGAFEVLRRGGNIAVQLFSKSSVANLKPALEEALSAINGVVDGLINQGIAATIPVQVGFSAIERVLNTFVLEHPGLEWYYGNVYDPRDGVTPLNWWKES